MLRAIRLALGAAAVLFGGALIAQQPKGGAPADYFPIKKDTKWTYKVGDNTVEVRCVSSSKVGTEDHWLFETKVGSEAKTTEVFVVKTDGVYRTKVKDDPLTPPVKILPLPPNKDTSWDVNTKLGTQTVKGTLKVVKDKDPIETPGGKFEAVLVEGKDMDVAGSKTTVRIWFAKGVGIVKAEFTLANGDPVRLELAKDGYQEGK